MPCKTIVLVGQTASGKTATAIALAQAIQGEIISADSRQVYRRLDIGSDKVTHDAMRGVPHHLIDVASPLTDKFTVSNFVEQARAAMQDMCARGTVPIVAGGTMLYIDALCGNVQVPDVPPNPTLRAELEQRGLASLLAELQEKDPVRAATIEPGNKRRLIRALEIVAVRGTVPPLQVSTSDVDILWLGLYNDSEIQRGKIEQRNAAMLEHGLLDEVQTLHESGVPWERFSEFGFEYKYPAMHLQGEITKDECLQKMNQGTWRYARKQKSWWKDRSEIHWFKPSEYKQLLRVAQEFLQ